MKNTFLAISLMLSLALSAQAQNNKLDSLVIRTSAVCDMCEETIESNLIYEKGVKSVDLDLATSEVKVDYDPRKTSPDKIRTALTKLGYYADDLPGDEKAYRDLPDCCQKEGCGTKPAEKHAQ